MSGENKKKQGNFGFPVAYIGAIVLNLACFTVGQLFCDGYAYAAPIAVGLMLLLCLLPGISMLAARLYWKYLDKQGVRGANDEADVRMERMKLDPAKEWARFRRRCGLSAVYVALLWVICLAVPFFCGADGGGTKLLPFQLFALFFLSGLVGKCIRPKVEENPDWNLKEKDFPLLFKFVREIGKEKLSGRKLNIRVLSSIPHEECNASVIIRDKEAILCLGAVLLCVLDEAELKQILLHELAHLNHEDMTQDKTFRRLMNYMTADSRSTFGGLLEMALRFPCSYLQREGSFFFTLSSRDREYRADGSAASQGDKQKQASALAKIAAHDLYVFEQEPYGNLYCTSEVPQHMLTDRARAFRNALVDRDADWRRILENAIPSRVSTHPIFRQRWEALGCCEYTLSPAETESDFARECWAAAETTDQEFASMPKEEYSRLHQEYYLDQCAIIEKYESADRTYSPDELREPMMAYYRTSRPDKMEEICDQILREQESPFASAYASFWKGKLLLYRYDRAGLAYIYKAMEANTNYVQEGLDSIGDFCTQMGLQEDLDEYRSRAADFAQLAQDHTSEGIHNRSKLTSASLPEGWQDKILEFIQSVCGDDLKAVYLVKELISDDYTPSSFVLRFRENTPDERADQMYGRVFRLLDDWPEDYEFALYTYEDSMEKALARVEGSCLYQAEE